MRIIDNNTDFYDYLQNVYRDNSLVFDRTGSFVLTKEMLCGYLYVHRYYFNYEREQGKIHHNFLLLQVCNTFWLFLVEIKTFEQTGLVLDYEIKLIKNWKYYSKERVLLSLDVVSFNYGVEKRFQNSNHDNLVENSEILVQSINTNDYEVERHIDKQIIYTGDSRMIEKNFPLLKACGVADLIDPLDIFLSFEEYFSTEKSASERTEAIGSTNDDKIESHGFDIKTSFRGRQ